MDLSHRLSALAVVENDIVVVVGLQADAAQPYNFCPGTIVQSGSDNGRIGVRLLHQDKLLSCRRRNLLRAAHPADRDMLMTRIVWERQLELRVVRNFLLEQLEGEEGLVLHIASFFPPRMTMALTTGFAMGRIVPTWSCAALSSSGRLQWQPIHADAGRRVHGSERVADGIIRIDCAVVDIGRGSFVVAGGCADHPSRASRFFRSAFI